MISVPNLDADGHWNYQIDALPKPGKYKDPEPPETEPETEPPETEPPETESPETEPPEPTLFSIDPPEPPEYPPIDIDDPPEELFDLFDPEIPLADLYGYEVEKSGWMRITANTVRIPSKSNCTVTANMTAP